MVNTRASGSGSANEVPVLEAPSPSPAPPQAPNLVEVMACQTELLQRLADARMNQGGQQHQVHQPRVSTFAEFLGTQPPLFSRIEDLLDADAWLHMLESKFSLLVGDCPEDNKAKFAAQQLRGPAQL